MATRYGASRLPVREALRMLESDGLTEYHPQRGARVPRLSPHEVDLTYEMRERLEPLALTESIPNLAAADVAALHSLQDEIEQRESLEGFIALDREFHLATYAGCQMDQLIGTVHRLWNITQPYRRLYVGSIEATRWWVIHAEHRLLIDAIERRDSVDAERVLAGHIRRTRIELAANARSLDDGSRRRRPAQSTP